MDMKVLGWFVYFVFCGAEMQAMTTIFGLKNMSKHRQAEADVLCSPEYKDALQSRGIQLVGYQTVLDKEKMSRPFVSDKYEEVVKQAIGK